MTTDVVLRSVRDDDLDHFFEYQLDPAANHMVAFIKRDPTDRNVFEEHWAEVRADDTVTIRTIVFADHAAGYVGSYNNSGNQEVFYWIGKPYWGKGIATTALTLLLAELKIRPLHAAVAKDNHGSVRVLEKCGFTVFDQLRSYSTARGEEIDEVLLKLE